MNSTDFDKAFNLIMLSEVGPWFNPADSATQQGLIDSLLHKHNCGYTNLAGDSGGETKFGIAQNKNPNVNVRTLTLEQSKNIYINQYWLPAHCDKIASPLSILHFDTAVNMGIGAAAKILQTALGVAVDGAIGPQTLASIAAIKNVSDLCSKYLDARQAKYDAIVLAVPSDAQFAHGWANRVNSLRSWLKTQ